MHYLMLMWTNRDAASGDQSDVDAWIAFDAQARDAGVLVQGAALQPPRQASLVHPDKGSVEEGTYGEGDVQIQAYYLLDCPDDDAAREWAARLPTHGHVEVRPVIEYDVGRD